MTVESNVKKIHKMLQPYLYEYGYKSSFLKIKDAIIHYVKCGKGKPIILLHGFGSFLFTWRKNIHALARGHAVYAIDLPGFGLSTEPPGFKNGLTAQADFLVNIIESLKIQNSIMIGHSFGGAVCIEFGQRHQKLVQAFVLVASSIPGRVNTSESIMKNLLLFKYFRKENITPDLLDVVKLINGKKQPDDLKTLIESTSFDKDLTLNFPGLIVWGDKDKILPLKIANDIEQFIKSSQLKIIKDCGHAPHEERSGDFNELILNFLDGSAMSEYQS